MDSRLYKAIQDGENGTMEQLIKDNLDQSGSGDDHYLLQAMTTSLNSSPLHVAAQFNQVKCLEEIFNRCPSLLMKQNSEGDTPLHIASRMKLDTVVGKLIDWATNSADGAGDGKLTKLQQLVRTRNKKNDTALHETLQYVGHSNLVPRLLINADPGFDYFANDAGETPLYLAVKNATTSDIEYILEKSPSHAHGAPDGKTVLHIAIQLKDHIHSASTVELLLKNKPHIVKEMDKDGRSALHYAAFIHDVSAFMKILDADSSVGYLRDKDGMTALHYAAGRYLVEGSSGFLYPGTKKMNGKLGECCPDCWEMKDN